jgi:hypothetical protein
MSTQGQPSEDELRAAYEAEMKRVRVDDLLLDNVVNMVNFGMRRTGLMPGTETERDPAQVQLAIESVRALLPLVETIAPEQVSQIRQALSQLQLAYVQIGGGSVPAAPAASAAPAAPAAPAAEAEVAPQPAASPREPEPQVKPGEPGPAQRSGRLWVPGS